MLQNFGTALSREQMKNVMGGDDPCGDDLNIGGCDEDTAGCGSKGQSDCSGACASNPSGHCSWSSSRSKCYCVSAG